MYHRQAVFLEINSFGRRFCHLTWDRKKGYCIVCIVGMSIGSVQVPGSAATDGELERAFMQISELPEPQEPPEPPSQLQLFLMKPCNSKTGLTSREEDGSWSQWEDLVSSSRRLPSQTYPPLEGISTVQEVGSNYPLFSPSHHPKHQTPRLLWQ